MLPALYAHRLGRGYGPDSSRAALERTLAGPIDGLETDCCLTADGDIALLNDPLLDLCTTLSGWAHEHRAEAIRSARLRHHAGSPTDERPLMLDDLLDGVPPGLPLQLEVKAHADAALATRTARTLCDRLRDHPRRDDIEVLSFWTGACAIAAELGFRARLVIIAGYQIPALAAWARRAGVGGVCVEHFLLTPALITTLHAAGLSVTTGTVNHAALQPRLLPLGLDAITSDVPHELRDGAAAPAALLMAA